METDFQTAPSKRAVARRPFCWTSEVLSRTHSCPWQLYTMRFNAGLPGFLLCQPGGWLDRSVARWLVGSLADWSALWDQHSGRAHPAPHKRLIRDARQQARAFTELMHTAVLDGPAPLQTPSLSVAVFAWLLCLEMERVCMTVPVEQCKYPPRGEDLFHLVRERCWMNWTRCCMLHSERSTLILFFTLSSLQ